MMHEVRDASLAAAASTRAGSYVPAPRALIEACGLPEIGPQLAGMSVRLEPTLRVPFTLAGDVALIRPDIARSEMGAAIVLREAIEIHALSMGTPGAVHRVLAHATAAVYSETTLRESQSGGVPAGLVAPGVGGARLGEDGSAKSTGRTVVEFLQLREDLPELSDDELNVIEAALPLAIPTEVLLTMGGDHRQQVDWSRGVNSYGLSPRPIPWTAQFGSCTASAPSERAFIAADAIRHRLIRACLAGELEAAVEQQNDAVRAGLLRALGIDPSIAPSVVLTPSGTDAELVALAVAAEGAASVRTIVVAPDEVGSGSVLGASGRYFSKRTPMGPGSVEGGTVVPGFGRYPVDVEGVEVRDSAGALRSPADVEEQIERIIVDAPDRVVVHVVEGSKTGVRLPRMEAASRWAVRWPDKVRVVVDAAQMRVDQPTIEQHLDAGHMVFVTGSKFFGGPPFSGAVLLPRRHAAVAAGLQSGPVGVGEFLSRFDVPRELPGLRALGAPRPNYGLVARWAAASVELASFHNTSPEIRDEVLRRLARGILDHIEAESSLALVDSPFTALIDAERRSLDDLPTIFTFTLTGPDGRPFDVETARQVQQAMVRDLGTVENYQPPRERSALGQSSFFLGQPVRVPTRAGRVAGALRFAVGAPTVSRVVFDHTRGRTWEDRLAAELADVKRALGKLAVLVADWDKLRDSQLL
jgi:hypothetical protein